MQLHFNDPDEFLTELRQAPPTLEPVLRLTVRHHLDRQTGVFRHLTVVASFPRVLPGPTGPLPLVVLLESYQGEDWGNGIEESRKTRQRAEILLKRLREAAQELRLECQPGVYHPE